MGEFTGQDRRHAPYVGGELGFPGWVVGSDGLEGRPFEKGEKGNSPLHWAAKADMVANIRLLLPKIGADCSNDNGVTPLMVAVAFHAQKAIAELAPVSRLDRVDMSGRTALMMAACNKDTPPGVLARLAIDSQHGALDERRMVEAAKALGACMALGNEKGAEALIEFVEALVVKAEMLRDTRNSGGVEKVLEPVEARKFSKRL